MSAALRAAAKREIAMSKHLERDLDDLQKDLLALAASVEEAIHKAIRALQDRDVALAKEVIAGDNDLDEEVDRYNNSIIHELIRFMQRSPDMVEPGLSFFSATRHLERIADHATNVAEDVIYLVEGAIVRHRPSAVRGEDS